MSGGSVQGRRETSERTVEGARCNSAASSLTPRVSLLSSNLDLRASARARGGICCGVEISHHPLRGQGWAGVSASGRLGPGRWASSLLLKACLPGSCLGSFTLPKPSRRHPFPLFVPCRSVTKPAAKREAIYLFFYGHTNCTQVQI